MKRSLLALLLAALLLAGCTGNAAQAQTEAPTAEPAEEPLPPETTDEPLPAETAEEQLPLDPELPIGELSKADATYYVNQKLAIGCTLNDEWFVIPGEDPRESAADGHIQFIDMAAQRRDLSAGLNVLIDDVSMNGEVMETPEEYRDLSIPDLVQMAEGSGMKDVHAEANVFSLAGQEYPGIRFTCTMPHEDYYCQQIVIGCGKYIVTVTLSTYDTDGLEELAKVFYPLEP